MRRREEVPDSSAGFGINALAWCGWGLAAVTTALVERNPYVQALLVAEFAAIWLAWSRRRTATVWVSVLLLGMLPIVFSLVFSRFGAHVLFQLPAWIPIVGGPWTLEAALFGANTGAALLLTVLVFAIAQSAIATADLLGVLPPPLYRLGTLVAVALALVPQTLASLRAVSETRQMRGVRAGRRSGLGLLLPVLLTTMERALQYAESLDARGFGSRRRTRYRPTRWGLEDVLVCVGAAASLAASLLVPTSYDPYLQLVPVRPPTTLMVWLLPLSLPAWVAGLIRRPALDRR